MAISMQGKGISEDSAQVTPAAEPSSVPPPYQVHLPGFEGPLALLLHLIERNQLEITTISLVTVTDQFIHYLRTWDEPSFLPQLAEFVAMAARLLLIKSRSLLPAPPHWEARSDESDPLEDAEQLRKHLLEYKMAREIAEALRKRELAGLQTFARSSRLVDAEALIDWRAPQIVGVNIAALAAVFQRVLTEKRLSQPEELPLPPVTIAEKIAEVERILNQDRHTTLEAVLQRASTRFIVVVMFLAVLELWHQARIIVTQEDLFGSIEIQPGPNFAHLRQTSPGSGADEQA
ncbi:MAG: segregation and condensation protein A [Ktedonobacterales bacterium]